MSILLEALRKSERDRHRSRPADIHSGELQDPRSDWPKKGLLALLIIVATTAIAWFAYHQYQKSDWNKQPPVAKAPEHALETEPQAAKPGTGNSKKLQSQSDQTPIAAKGAKSQARTPVESFQQDSGDGAATVNRVKRRATPYIISTPANQSEAGSSKKATAKKPAARKPGSKKTVARKPGSKKTVASKPDSKKTVASKPDSKKTVARKTPSQKPAAGKSAKVKPAAAEKEFRPEPPAPISYWELPDAIRAKVPEIKFSVLVYASESSDRFVLINGARLKEGDKVSPGLLVKEIRRDGIVCKYQLYEFLVER